MIEDCGMVCGVCADSCDLPAGHGGTHHYREHDRRARLGLESVVRPVIFSANRSRPNDPPVQAPTRPSWSRTWMQVAQTIAQRSYDPRLRVGAIVVTDDNTQMLAVGYNGNYKGGPHEHESPEPGQSGFIHAEVNCLVKCDYNHHKPKHMYVTHSPCRDCTKLIINAGISRVVYGQIYRDISGLDLLRGAGIEVYSGEEAILMADDEDAAGR